LAILPAVVLIQACLGGVYAWSAFVPFLTADDGLSMSRAQFVFGLAILTFTVAMVAAGQLLTRWGPRRVALLGALFFSVGHMITAGAGRHFPWLIGGYGLSVGIGIGFGYVAALTSGVQWFPQRKGMVTGVAVAGFGLGGLLLASLAGNGRSLAGLSRRCLSPSDGRMVPRWFWARSFSSAHRAITPTGSRT
jgi:MFS transporter, OFA family, oxalate/formate antiporter